MHLDLPIQLHLLPYRSKLKIKNIADKKLVWDIVRKKYVSLLPEELVRQLLIHYLIDTKKYVRSRLRVEMGLEVNGLSQRCDILYFDADAKPFLLVECKSFDISISQTTFEQIARYNMPLRVPYLLATNGLMAYICEMDYEKETYHFLDDIPMAATK